MQISVEADIRKAVSDLNVLLKDADRAAGMAINKVADKVKSEAASIISARTRLPIRKVRKRITIRRASRGNLIAIVTGNSYSPNMGNYSPSQSAYGTGATVPPGRRVAVSHAFIMKRKGNPVMIRQKVGGGRVARKPLESVRVEVLKRTWVQSTVNQTLERVISERWPIEFNRALKVVVPSLRVR